METGEGITFETVMNGLNQNGDLICKFKFLWSIKEEVKLNITIFLLTLYVF